MLVITALRSAVFNVYFIVCMLVFSCLAIASQGRSQKNYVPKLWAASILWGLRYLAGIRLDVRGQEHLPKPPFIVASKHQSAMETIFFWLFLDHPVYILKAALLKIPFFGPALKIMGSIPVRQRGANATTDMLNKVGQAFDAGHQLVIFPEGTRTAPGAEPRYRKGIVRIHEAFPEVPVIPVALDTGVVWPRRSFLKKPGTAHIVFLPALQPTAPETFLHDLETTIETASLALLEASAAR